MKRRSRNGRWQRLAWVVTLLAGPTWGLAAEVSLDVSMRETYVGVPVTVQIEIANAREHDPPTLPEIPNATVRSAGTPSQSTQMSVINGKMSRSTTLTYAFQVTPHAKGRLVIPSIEVKADGQIHRTEPMAIVVADSKTEDVLFVELKGDRDSVYVGEPLEITLQIWIRPFIDQNYHVKLNEGQTWNLIEVDKSEWGVFLDVLQQMYSERRRPRGQEMLRLDSAGNERSYYLYELTKTIWPSHAGQIGVGDINVIVVYPIRLGRDRSIFSRGNLTITHSKPMAGQVEVEPIVVKPIPAEGRPAFYAGAVGQYTITATAKPTEVAVGEPITLTMSISGTGQLERLQPPPLPEIEALTADFKVPTDPLGGEVQGDSKVFSQSIRAKSDQVAAIPPIPFAYFDPQAEQFVTVETTSIPLKVKPSAELSVGQIVDASTVTPRASRSLTEVTGGILANYSGEDVLLAQHGFQAGWAALGAVACPPVLFAIAWFVQYRRERLRNDVSLARRRSARANARRKIQSAGREESRAVPAAVGAAIGGYVADRCNLPGGGLTRAEVVTRLGDANVSSDCMEAVNTLLGECESMQYAGSAGDSADGLVRSALALIDRLERERF